MRKYNLPTKILIYLILIIVAISVLLPLTWVVSNSFRPDSEIGKYVKFNKDLFIPQQPTFQNYIELFTKFNFGRYILNTVFVTAIVTVGSLFLNSLAAYGFARFEFPGRNIIFTILLITLMVPGESILLSQFMLIRSLHLIDSLAALVLPSLAGAMGIFFFRQSFINFPKAIEESAILDGCSRIGIYFKILMPLSTAPIITMTIMTVTGQWDSFIWPLTVIRDSKKYVIQIGVNYLFGQYSNHWGNIFASAVVTAIPMIILFLFLQKYFVKGIASAGVKG